MSESNSSKQLSYLGLSRGFIKGNRTSEAICMINRTIQLQHHNVVYNELAIIRSMTTRVDNLTSLASTPSRESSKAHVCARQDRAVGSSEDVLVPDETAGCIGRNRG